MSLLELSNPTTTGPEYSNISKPQEKECKIVCMNIIEVLKKNLKKSKKSPQTLQTLEVNDQNLERPENGKNEYVKPRLTEF